jgi:hypothetical protein
MDSCTRIIRRLRSEVWEITGKLRLAFNQIVLSEPEIQNDLAHLPDVSPYRLGLTKWPKMPRIFFLRSGKTA